MLPNFTYVRPTNVRRAIEQLSSPGTHVHAGGTDVLGCLRDRVFSATKLVALTGISELSGIGLAPDSSLRIGTLTTLAEIAAHPLIAQRYAALAQGAAAAASPQLRNQGTIGGNLCQRPRCWYFRGDFYCLRKGGDRCYAVAGENEFHCILGGSGCYIVHPSDTAPALVALGAEVHMAGPKGVRVVPLQSFFLLPAQDLTKENSLQPGEIITHIVMPAPSEGLRSSYRKVRARGSWDFALAGVALALSTKNGRVERGRIVLSGVAPIPWRAIDGEKALIGQKLDAETAARVADASVKGAEPMTQNGYKVDLVRAIVEEAILAMA